MHGDFGFNIENKLYTIRCYPLQINGVDLNLEDKVVYLYPNFTFVKAPVFLIKLIYFVIACQKKGSTWIRKIWSRPPLS